MRWHGGVERPELGTRALPRLVAAVAALASLFGTARIAASQEPSTRETDEPPSFPARVELVTVDVAVIDSDGNPVTGLTPEDFAVYEEDRRHAIDSFEAVEVPAPPTPRPDEERTEEAEERPLPRLSENDDAGDTGRTFALLFDDTNLTRLSAHRAKGAAAEFLRRGVRDGDRVMLVSTSGDAWWSEAVRGGAGRLSERLDLLQGKLALDLSPERITPWEAMQIQLYRNQDVAFRVTRRLEKYNAIPAGVSPRPLLRDALDNPVLLQRAQEVYIGARSRARATLKTLDRLLVSLESTKGRKGLILISDGFIYDTGLPEIKRAVESARRSNVVVYFVDARGLEGMPAEMTAQFGHAPEARDLGINALGGEYMGAATFLQGDLSSEGTQSIAAESGGFTVKNTNDLAAGIERIARESEAYYLIGYYPTQPVSDGSFREIRVEVAREGVEVRARKGYYAPLPGEDEPAAAADGQPRFQPVLDSPYDRPDIPLRMSSLVFQETLLGKAKVLVVADVDVRELEFEEVGGRLVDALEYILVVARAGEHFRYDEKIDLDLRPEGREALEESWYTIAKEFDLESGTYQAKIVVSDQNGGGIGSVTHDFVVPALGGLRTSTPIVTDRVQEGGSRPRPVLRLPRRYSRDSVLFCEYEVYGAARGDSGLPQVVAGYRIRDGHGATVVNVAPTPIRSTSLGQLSRLLAAPLASIPDGKYELVLELRDEVAGAALEVREPFEVAGDS